jgi:hypothetical protein
MLIHPRLRKTQERSPDRLGCHLPFIEYNKQELLAEQENHINNYKWYHDHLEEKFQQPVNTSRFHYKYLADKYISSSDCIVRLAHNVRKHIPLLNDVSFNYAFAKFDESYTLEIHKDIGRDAAIFFPLTDDSSPTDFYRNNQKIKSFSHTSALLLAVSSPHGSHVVKEKITFQIGFNYPNWDELLDSCIRKT